MKRQLATALLACALHGALQAQTLPEPKPSFQGLLLLPVPLRNPVFGDLTEVLGQVEGAFQVPLFKGLGVGVGAKFNWYGLEEHGLAQLITNGEVRRMVLFGKLQYEHYTGPITYYELNAKAGQARWTWDCTTCADNAKQNAFHWGISASYFVHTSDNLAFGITLGYEADAASFGPGVIGLESFPGRKDRDAPYRFLTVGLGFSTRFIKSNEDGMW
ncbi:MAG: hypothetical protein QM724_09195 [Flavobacteriales bacterium]